MTNKGESIRQTQMVVIVGVVLLVIAWHVLSTYPGRYGIYVHVIEGNRKVM